jgi:WD40 repeat protein
MDKVKEFLNSEQKVFLLLGDPGAGKSTFSRALDRELWNTYKKDGDIPLHINLPAIDKPEHDMIAKQLRKMELTEPQIRELKVHRKFVLICDGYDESQQTHNLYTANELNEHGEWTAKMIISYRTEYLGIDYKDRFQPGDRNQQSKSTQFQEAVMTPFSESQIDGYINEYVSIHQPLWEAKDYKQALDLIPSLKELVKNPFLMTLPLEVMPRMMDPGEHVSSTHVTKVGLYDHFIEHWLERGKKRLGEKKLTPQSRAAFESLIDEGFTRNGIDFLKKLAVAVYKEQDGQPIVEFSRYKDEHSWKAEFFSRDDEKQLLRQACPLTRNGNQYRFIHRSLLEYGLALAIYDPYDWRQSGSSLPSLGRRGSVSSVSSFEIYTAPGREIRTIEQGPDLGSPLVWRGFMNEYSLVQFLEERVQQEPVFKQQLMDYIEYSKIDKKWRTAAANAITILVRAGVQLISADLQGIQVPGANLRHGVFDWANLQGADLRKVNLSNVSLRGSDLSGAQMKDVQFGELPFLKFDCQVEICVYSPDGTSFAVVLSDNTINMYATSNWERTWILSGHSSEISSIAYSPNGDQIVSGSWDSSVRIWDVTTEDCLYIFIGHTGGVISVAYSPQGNVVASRDGDGTVRLWDLESGDCRSNIFECGSILDMAFSPKGDTIAFGSKDFRVRIWDVCSDECRSILIGHDRGISTVVHSAHGDLISKDQKLVVRVWKVEAGACLRVLEGDECMLLSPKGNQVALYGRWGDEKIELWDTETGAFIRRLSGHKGRTSSLAYSPQRDQVVSGGSDMTVRLWDVETGECRQTMTGHTRGVKKVLFSPKGDYIASASEDMTVRLWNVGSGISQKISNYHSDGVMDLKYSLKRNQVASCSHDSTIRLWDAATGVHIRALTGHSETVYTVSYSPQEDRLVSCSWDKTVRLWDVESGACLHVLAGHAAGVKFSPQGRQVAFASNDEIVRLWSADTGECQHILIGHIDSVWIVTYSPQGGRVASADVGGTVRLWNVETGACEHTLTGHSKSIQSIVYSPNGNQIASASDDATVRLWDVKAGACSHIFIGHQSAATCVVYSLRGHQVASASYNDKSVRLWDTESGECCYTLTGHEYNIHVIAYSPKGNLIASWSDAGEAMLWDVQTGACHWNLNHDGSTRWGANSIAHPFVWMSSDVDTFITGCGDGSVGVWDVTREGDRYRVQMRWRSTSLQLTVKDACVQDVQGLNDLSKRLLKQRGAMGEPSIRLREASKKVMRMASVVAKLKPSSSNTEAPNLLSISPAISSTRQSGQQTGQATEAETPEN